MSTCWFLLFTGMPHQQPPISIPPPGHPPAPAPHVNPAFFPPQHGGPPPTMVRIKWTYENYNNINWIKFIHSFCYFKKLFLIDYWMFYICTFIYLFQPHAAPGHHDPYRAPPPVSYPSDHYARPPTERWHSYW